MLLLLYPQLYPKALSVQSSFYFVQDSIQVIALFRALIVLLIHAGVLVILI